MMLREIRRYIRMRGQTSLADLATHLDSSPDAVRGMLDVWVRKGKIGRLARSSRCGTACAGCAAAMVEIYYWKEDDCDPPSTNCSSGPA
ncbi:MAG: sugar metabolism transcriptional regulator [Proteobacteria bacterium]|nr:MAG: sugar metabolism transcriptional regulator [Pseudomonadota bacterium]